MSRITLSKRSLAPLLCLALIGLAPLAQATEVYRWKDANGVTHYGERPPEGIQAERVALRPEPSVAPPPSASTEAAASAAAQIDDPNLTPDQRAELARQRALEANAEARRQARAANCARAQQNLQTLRNSEYVSLRDGDTTRTLTALERQQQIEENEAAEAENCGADNDAGG
jgi:hypothetical protein